MARASWAKGKTMGTKNLSPRDELERGDTVTSELFTRLQDALNGEFVGRSNDVAEPGQSLGNPALAWGTLYCQTINLGGQILDAATAATAPGTRIISGLSSAKSSAPRFLELLGNKLQVNGANTPLQLSSGGEQFSISQVASVGLDSFSEGTSIQALTHDLNPGPTDWGDVDNYGSRGRIEASGFGSEILARIGQWSCFKIGTEYFYAFIESFNRNTGTGFLRPIRGFFADSNGNPFTRATWGRFNTISMVRTHWIYANKNNPNAIFSTLISPTNSFGRLASGTAGQHNFRMDTGQWEIYDGTTWTVADIVHIGVVGFDGATVAIRSYDFYRDTQNKNNLRWERDGNRMVCRAGGEINIYGKNLRIPRGWAFDASTDDAVKNKQRYWVYMRETGQLYASIHRPVWRDDFGGGRYHPTEADRCVFEINNEGSNTASLTDNSNWFPYQKYHENELIPIEDSFFLDHTLAGSQDHSINSLFVEKFNRQSQGRFVVTFKSGVFTVQPVAAGMVGDSDETQNSDFVVKVQFQGTTGATYRVVRQRGRQDRSVQIQLRRLGDDLQQTLLWNALKG